MRSTVPALVMVALLAGSPAPARTGEDRRVPTAAELRQCPHLARVDWRRVARELAEGERDRPAAPYDYDAEHRRIRGPWPLPDIGRAEIVIDIAIGPGETQEYPTSTSAFVWREPGGQWQVDRIDHISASLPSLPPGSPVMTEEEIERAQRPATRGPLSASQAAAIDRVLADPCFAIQPDYTPFHMPLRTGQIDSCYGAINSAVRIRRGSETRLVSDICSRWPSAELANAVMYAAIGLGTLIEQTARARFPDGEIRIVAMREGRRTSIYPFYCGELEVGGRAVPVMFQDLRDGAWARRDLYVPGERNRWSASFEETWAMFCAPAQQPAQAPSKR
ncbi:MAG: hypothetical protein E6G92_08645 [Alphaproteobacteria bacterium]|nr:MAG: hypothetical protein E6G92_08645 [Alphaproteobacteria bacterium]